MFLRKIFGSKPKTVDYPITVEQKLGDKSVIFEVFSSVEKFRIAEYGGEKTFLDKFLGALLADDVVFDIGASVGLVAVHSAAIVEQGQVVAFEPDPETFKRLLHNMDLNSLSNVIFVRWAVSDADGEVTLFSDGASGFAPTLRKQTNRPGAPEGEVRVQTRTLDDAISSGELPHPTVLKIDIEGAEILCVKGARELLGGGLGAKPRLIFLELHPQFLPDFGSSTEEVHGLILEQGYRVLWESKRDDQIHYCYTND